MDSRKQLHFRENPCMMQAGTDKTKYMFAGDGI